MAFYLYSMNNISTKKDVIKLVDCFYDQVKTDPTIGSIFNAVAQLDWEHHLPQMYNFWASILLGDQSYQGRPIPKHILLL